MGVTTSNLEYIAYLGPELCILPLMMSMFLYSRTLLGWGITCTTIIIWHIAFREAFGINNPLSQYAGPALTQSLYIYNGIYLILVLVSALVGTAISWLLNFTGMLPFYAWLGSTVRHYEVTYDTKNKCGSQIETEKKSLVKEVGLTRWGISGIQKPSFVYISMMLFLFCLTYILPFATSSILLFNKYALWIPALINFAIPPICYGFMWLWCRYYTDLYAFGPTESNIKTRNALNPDNLLIDFDETRYVDTQNRINIQIGLMCMFHVLGIIIVHAVFLCFVTPNADNVWIAGFSVVGGFLLFTLIIYVIMRWYYKKEITVNRRNKGKLLKPDGEPEDMGASQSLYNATRRGYVSVLFDQ